MWKPKWLVRSARIAVDVNRASVMIAPGYAAAKGRYWQAAHPERAAAG